MSEDMRERYAEIETRLKAATPGTWEATELPPNELHKRPAYWVEAEYHEPSGTHSKTVADVTWSMADAEFIAHAREDVPFLLQQVHGAVRAFNEERAENERLRRELEEAKRGGKELGRVVERLADVMRTTVMDGVTDPYTALINLTDWLAEGDSMTAEEHGPVVAALRAEVRSQRQAGELAAENERIKAAIEPLRALLERWEQGRGTDRFPALALRKALAALQAPGVPENPCPRCEGSMVEPGTEEEGDWVPGAMRHLPYTGEPCTACNGTGSTS